MKRSKKIIHSDGSIPQSVINQIGEFTVGGFMLFYYNQETGQPDQFVNFDSPAHCLGLQKYVSDWLHAVNEASLNNSINNIQKSIDQLNNNGENGDDQQKD